MASNIDVTKPESGAATTQSVRDNFQAAKDEIETLQSSPTFTGNVTVEGTFTADDFIVNPSFPGVGLGVNPVDKTAYMHVAPGGGNGASGSGGMALFEGLTDAYITIAGDTSAEAGINLGDSSNSDAFRIFYDNADNDFILRAGSISALRIDSSGNLGLGTDATNSNQRYADLTIGGNDLSTAIHVRNFQDGDGGISGVQGDEAGIILTATDMLTGYVTPSIRFGSNDGDFAEEPAPRTLAAITGVAEENYVDNDSSAMGIAFLTSPDGAGSTGLAERMRIAENGRVGIGTSSPAQQLEVSAGIKGALLQLDGRSDGSPSLQFDGDTNTGIFSPGADTLGFTTGGSERMRIASDGKVGIGTTSPAAILEVDASAASVGDFGVAARFIADTAWARTDWQGSGVASTNSLIMYQNSEASGGISSLRNTYDDSRLEITQDGAGEIRLGVNGVTAVQVQGAVNNRTAFIGNGSANNVIYIDPDRSATEQAIWSNETGASFRIGLFNGSNAGNVILTAAGSGKIIFQSGGASEVARFGSNGFLGIGTSSPSAPLELERDSGQCAIFNRTGSDGTIMSFLNDGSTVGSISVSGAATAYNTSSDVRLKENIEDALASGPIIDGIDVRRFDWKADGSHQRFGVVAQELEQVFPEAVSTDDTEDGYKSVDYSKLVPLLVKEVQSLRARVEALGG